MSTTPYSQLSDLRIEADHLQDSNFVAILEGHVTSSHHRFLKPGAKIIVISLSAAAKISFWPVSKRLGRGIGETCALANCIAFFVLEYWAGTQTIDSIFAPKSEAERLMHKQNNRSRRYLFIPPALLIAVVSQLPSALAAVKYNSREFKIPAAVLLLVSNSIFPFRSMQLTLEALQRQTRNAIEQKLNGLRQEVASLLLANRTILTSSGRDNFVERFKSIQSLTSFDERKERYSHLLIQPIEVNQPSNGERRARQVGEAIGGLLNLFFQGAIGAYTFTETKKEIVDSNPLGGTFAALAVVSNIYLMGDALRKTTGRVFGMTYRIFATNHAPSLIEQLRPRLTFALKACGVVIDLFALGATIVVWSDFFEKNEKEKYSLTTLMCASIFMMVFTAMLDTVEGIIEQVIFLNGSQQEIELVSLDRKVRQIAESMKSIPLLHFATFILALPEEQRDSLLNKFEVTTQNLRNYVADRTPEQASSVSPLP